MELEHYTAIEALSWLWLKNISSQSLLCRLRKLLLHCDDGQELVSRHKYMQLLARSEHLDSLTQLVLTFHEPCFVLGMPFKPLSYLMSPFTMNARKKLLKLILKMPLSRCLSHWCRWWTAFVLSTIRHTDFCVTSCRRVAQVCVSYLKWHVAQIYVSYLKSAHCVATWHVFGILLTRQLCELQVQSCNLILPTPIWVTYISEETGVYEVYDILREDHEDWIEQVCQSPRTDQHDS